MVERLLLNVLRSVGAQSRPDKFGDPSKDQPNAGLVVRVTRAVTPITGQHEGLPSNRRREIAKSAPARINSAPTAPIGMIANSAGA